MSFCPQCGSQIRPGTAFCVNCGTSLAVPQLTQNAVPGRIWLPHCGQKLMELLDSS